MLSYSDIKEITEDTMGVKDKTIVFEHITNNSFINAKKGLFVSLNDENRDESLKRALYNGAIAAVWPKSSKLPRFLPNHFPIFIVDDPLSAFETITEIYLKKIEENGYDMMKKFTQFSYEKNDSQYVDNDRLLVDGIEKVTRAITMNEERRG